MQAAAARNLLPGLGSGRGMFWYFGIFSLGGHPIACPWRCYCTCTHLHWHMHPQPLTNNPSCTPAPSTAPTPAPLTAPTPALAPFCNTDSLHPPDTACMRHPPAALPRPALPRAVHQPLAVGAAGTAGHLGGVWHRCAGGGGGAAVRGPGRPGAHLGPQPHRAHELDGAADHGAGGAGRGLSRCCCVLLAVVLPVVVVAAAAAAAGCAGAAL